MIRIIPIGWPSLIGNAVPFSSGIPTDLHSVWHNGKLPWILIVVRIAQLQRPWRSYEN